MSSTLSNTNYKEENESANKIRKFSFLYNYATIEFADKLS